MEIAKFLRSLNTINTYLILSAISLITLIVWFYILQPK
ncbi:hypothetical protein MUB04_14360 [Acinetobacter indicus]|nr:MULTISPECIES: hypothetical protein [Acinetobacter]MCP0917714.1 hypothetical protein [Acinetobacter indicus]